MRISSGLWDAYKDSYFFINNELPLENFAVITAWNPHSRQVSSLENHLANRALSDDINEYNYCKIEVGDLKRGWLEESFAVELPQNLAIELGKKYNQNAIYYVRYGQLYLVSCLEDKVTERIGYLSRKTVIRERKYTGK